MLCLIFSEMIKNKYESFLADCQWLIKKKPDTSSEMFGFSLFPQDEVISNLFFFCIPGNVRCIPSTLRP